ncbi:hypothetical protein BH24GEM1_BH24GEM1_22750 [soil metagenome]
MLQGLTADQIGFVVVGGVAAAAHGSTLVTNDLDICYDTTEDNVTRLARRLAAWQAYPRGIEPGLPFFMDARTFRTTPSMTLQTSEGALDVLDRIEGVGTYVDLLRISDRVEALGTSFLALGLPALIRAKRAARRPKDLAHLPELEALLALSTAGKKRAPS